MQELLGKISALDPDASLGIRVIACFDELIRGNVNSRALLSTAASLAGCPAGLQVDDPARTMRMTPGGEELDGPGPGTVLSYELPGNAEVWLERQGAPHPNDAIIVERLALSIGVRLGMERRDLEPRRDLGTALDAPRDPMERRAAAERLGLRTGQSYRIVAAPLFAVWQSHPSGAGDVVNTAYGAIHIVVVDAHADRLDVRPSGAGIAVGIDDLDFSLRTAMVALQLCDGDKEPFVDADRYTGIVELLADSSERRAGPDVRAIADVMNHPWARSTLSSTRRRSVRLPALPGSITAPCSLGSIACRTSCPSIRCPVTAEFVLDLGICSTDWPHHMSSSCRHRYITRADDQAV
ncbi:hypothetical protein CH302_29240 [Rhodococcus sp. 15-2388-1-1a]|uniref:hypothetical protein n=1 Tax=Nocardiaceae TaxID=85025 RepID=UPI00068BBE39|nr:MULTISPECIES: hypothetical protein [Rhodococcus]OZE89170.1 hypothetical protein CH302_29240 [Rhodococcus sp. 15-2388-1-1a]